MGPLVQALSIVANDFPSNEILEEKDTKFNGLVNELNEYFSDKPMKIIVFSHFVQRLSI